MTIKPVTKEEIDNLIAAEFYTSGTYAALKSTNNYENNIPEYVSDSLARTTICILVTKSGFTFIGLSSTISNEAYNQELGMKYSKEHAIRQLWSHEAYNRLTNTIT